MATSRKCEGKRRMQRGNTFGLFKCGRKARFSFETYVGLTRSHYVCDDSECFTSITGGYSAGNVRELSK